MVIAIINNKGGVGKTTCTANLGVTLARNNRKVLMIDLDAQLSLSECFLMREDITDEKYFKKNTYWALSEFNINACDIAINIEKNLDIIIASIPLAGIELDLNNNYPLMENAVEFFKNAGKNYDYVLVDCPPNLGIATACAVLAADGVIIPVVPEPLAIMGLTLMGEFLNSCRIYNDFHIAAYKVLLFNVNKAKKKTQYPIIEQLKETYGKNGIFGTYIPTSTSLAAAPLHKKTILDYEPRGKAATAFKNFALELVANGFKRHANSIFTDAIGKNSPLLCYEGKDGVKV